MDEVREFFNTAKAHGPDGLTANEGRTVRFLVAHIASAFDEIGRHILGLIDDERVHRTKTFEEREEPFLNMGWSELLDEFEPAYERYLSLNDKAVAKFGEDEVLEWTNRKVKLGGFQKHVRNECALHRWDIVGDDEISDELLSNHELTRHTMEFLGAIPMQARGVAIGAGSGGRILERLRSPDRPDIVVGIHKEDQVLREADPIGEALIEGDPAARHLFLWGRLANPAPRLVCTGSPERLRRLSRLLSGY